MGAAYAQTHDHEESGGDQNLSSTELVGLQQLAGLSQQLAQATSKPQLSNKQGGAHHLDHMPFYIKLAGGVAADAEGPDRQWLSAAWQKLSQQLHTTQTLCGQLEELRTGDGWLVKSHKRYRLTDQLQKQCPLVSLADTQNPWYTHITAIRMLCIIQHLVLIGLTYVCAHYLLGGIIILYAALPATVQGLGAVWERLHVMHASSIACVLPMSAMVIYMLFATCPAVTAPNPTPGQGRVLQPKSAPGGVIHVQPSCGREAVAVQPLPAEVLWTRWRHHPC